MRDITLKVKQVVVEAEKTYSIPTITGFCETEDCKEICDALHIKDCPECGCEECILDKRNFEAFKQMLNEG